MARRERMFVHLMRCSVGSATVSSRVRRRPCDAVSRSAPSISATAAHVPRLGAARAAGRGRRRRATRRPLEPRSGDRVLQRRRSPRRRRSLPVPARRRRDALSGSGVAISAGRSARSVGGRRSARVSRGPTRRGAASRSTARSSTSCTSARSRATARGRRPRASCAELARVGITLIEVMPVAEFDGRFGWGYDGVDLFAPTQLYGTPDDFRRFVDARARASGIGVILDVVYNHLGPTATTCARSRRHYFTDRYDNEWGDAINFDGADAGAGARVLRRQRRLLDRRVSSRRPAARRDAADLRRVAGAHPRRDRRGARASGAARGRIDRRRRERAAGHAAGAAGRARAATASTRCGTTTSITARWSR